MNNSEEIFLKCPVPLHDKKEIITLAHGSGGSLTNDLIRDIFSGEFSNEYLDEMHDGAVFQIDSIKLAFSTDSFVVDPLFFPGGNIGDLAVNGTVNDLAMCGAKPLFLSAGFIIEEGLPIDDLKRIVSSMKKAADACGVKIITGDTKVVQKGKGDKLFINTTGIGTVSDDIIISPSSAQPGDKIILSGTIADHGIAVTAARENLGFLSSIISDTAALNFMIENILKKTKNIHVLRDPTRGGLAGVLNEISEKSNVNIKIYEDRIPVNENVKAACEILGFDPLYIANEGKFICILPRESADTVLNEIRKSETGKNAEIIGEVLEGRESKVILQTLLGTDRIIDRLPGDQLPRIC